MTASTRIREAAARLSSARGQSIIEFSVVLPIVLVLVLGVVELSYALLDHHVVTKLAREGSNLISREVPLDTAATAIGTMSTAPVNLSDGSSCLIFSVVKRGATIGTANYDKMVLWQRYTAGSMPGCNSKLTGSGTFPPPEYTAPNSDSNTALRVTNLPSNLATVPGGMIYVTEIYSTHELITPFQFVKYGTLVPSVLYSIAYF